MEDEIKQDHDGKRNAQQPEQAVSHVTSPSLDRSISRTPPRACRREAGAIVLAPPLERVFPSAKVALGLILSDAVAFLDAAE
jgi:hypothetical protein